MVLPNLSKFLLSVVEVMITNVHSMLINSPSEEAMKTPEPPNVLIQRSTGYITNGWDM